MNQSIFARVSNLEDICSKTDHNQVENLAQINNLSQNVSIPSYSNIYRK